MKKQFLEMGKVVTTHGIRGEVRVQAWCDSPELLCEFDHLYLENGKPVTILSARVHKNVVIVKLDGVDTVEAAQQWRGVILYVDRAELDLPEDTYFIQDLMGLSVYDTRDGRCYGEIVDITQTGANDVYHIKDDNGVVVLVPAIADVVKLTDIDGGRMEILPLRGLFEDIEEVKES